MYVLSIKWYTISVTFIAYYFLLHLHIIILINRRLPKQRIDLSYHY